MKVWISNLFLAIVFLSSLTLFGQGAGNKPGGKSTDEAIDKEAMKKEVQDASLHAWNGYKEYAWGMDIDGYPYIRWNRFLSGVYAQSVYSF